jgi:hypothetical protein
MEPGIGEEIAGDGEPVAQVGEVAVDAVAPSVAEGFDLLGLAGDVAGVAVLYVAAGGGPLHFAPQALALGQAGRDLEGVAEDLSRARRAAGRGRDCARSGPGAAAPVPSGRRLNTRRWGCSSASLRRGRGSRPTSLVWAWRIWPSSGFLLRHLFENCFDHLVEFAFYLGGES